MHFKATTVGYDHCTVLWMLFEGLLIRESKKNVYLKESKKYYNPSENVLFMVLS